VLNEADLALGIGLTEALELDEITGDLREAIDEYIESETN
jgi:hypothetical protein